MLTERQTAEFEERGFVRIQAAFDPVQAREAANEIWRRLEHTRGVNRNDPSSWRIAGPWVGLKALRETFAFQSLGSPALESAIDGLLGRDRWTRLEHWGGFLVNFPDCTPDDWRLPTKGWHVDFQLNHEVGSAFGVQTFVYLADVRPRAGGTLVVAGSHRLVERFVGELTEQDLREKYGVLRDRFNQCDPWLAELNSGRTLDPEETARFTDAACEVAGVPVRVEELTAQCGDAFLVHPWLVHAAAPNAGPGPRLVLHRNIHAHDPTRR